MLQDMPAYPAYMSLFLQCTLKDQVLGAFLYIRIHVSGDACICSTCVIVGAVHNACKQDQAFVHFLISCCNAKR